MTLLYIENVNISSKYKFSNTITIYCSDNNLTYDRRILECVKCTYIFYISQSINII